MNETILAYSLSISAGFLVISFAYNRIFKQIAKMIFEWRFAIHLDNANSVVVDSEHESHKKVLCKFISESSKILDQISISGYLHYRHLKKGIKPPKELKEFRDKASPELKEVYMSVSADLALWMGLNSMGWMLVFIFFAPIALLFNYAVTSWAEIQAANFAGVEIKDACPA